MPTSDTVASVAEEIISMLQQHGASEYIGEPVSKLEHMVQSAMLAEQQQLSNEIVVAALLHDIGHVCIPTSNENDMDGFGVVDHEMTGAAYLEEKGFPERIVQVVANHVPAKRYLCFKYPDYYEALSNASMQTLQFQGGPMNKEEAAAFESLQYFTDIIAVRKIDEAAKIEGMPIPPLYTYRQLIMEVLLTA